MQGNILGFLAHNLVKELYFCFIGDPCHDAGLVTDECSGEPRYGTVFGQCLWDDGEFLHMCMLSDSYIYVSNVS